MMIAVGLLVSKIFLNVHSLTFNIVFHEVHKKKHILGLHGLPTRTGKLKGLETFDANFFGVHAKQAEVMDPQLRLLLESTYECIVDAGE